MKAIPKGVPRGRGGIAFKDLPAKVAASPPRRVEAGGGSVSRHAKSVRLDLEARQEIEGIAGASPQRPRRRP